MKGSEEEVAEEESDNQNINMKAQVVRSMTAQLDEEIDLFEGDIVTITSIIDDMWYRGISGERTGIFPSSYVKLLPPYSNSNSQAVASTTLPKESYEPSSISARQLYKQCVESTTSEIGSSISSRQIYKHSADSTITEEITRNLGSENVDSGFQASLDIVPHAVTLYPFCSQFDNELSFKEGEIVKLIRYIDKYWMEGEINGKKGIFPLSYVKIIVNCQENIESRTLTEGNEVCEKKRISVNSYALVMYNFDAQMSDDLSVKESEKVLVVEFVNNDWCRVQNNAEQVGLVPCVYLSQVHGDTFHVPVATGQDAESLNLHEQKSETFESKCCRETSNTELAIHRDTQFHKYFTEPMDLDTAMSRNLAELSLSIPRVHNFSGEPRSGTRENKFPTCAKILEFTTDCEEPHSDAQPVDEHVKCSEVTTEYDEVVLRKNYDKAIEKPPDLHKRQSIDRIPHRPAPPAPVLGQQPRSVGYFNASGVDADVAPSNVILDVAVTEDHKVECERKKNVEQRQNVISELVFTEKEFSRDMKITYETFNLHNPSFLESYGVNVKLLFGNILEVIHLSEDFTDQLLLALKGKSEEDQCVGPCFMNMASQMKNVYSEYTVNHDNVLSLLEKYDSDPAIMRVLDKGVETLRYQISCFDMGSILIKPVQRVLKYPLIVNELIKFTEDDHEDKPDLLKAAVAMMDVANDINENKRRKDIVVKYLDDNPLTISSRISRISLHSVAKKSTRFGALLSSSLGIKSGAKDELYDEQETLFYNLDKMIRTFLKNVEVFVASLQEMFFIKSLIAENMLSFYDEDVTFDVEKYCKMVNQISSQFLNEFKRTLDTRVSIPLTLLLKCFEGPWKLVQKRYDKLLDYEAKIDKIKDNRQGAMTIFKNTFTALNNQLLEELPVLVMLSCEVFAECVKAFVLARKLFMGKVTKQYLMLFSEISQANPNNDEPLEQFLINHTLAWNQLVNLPSLIRQYKSDAGSVSLSKPSGSILQSINSPCGQSSSQCAHLQSYYHVSKLHQVIENYCAKEYMELTVNKGELVAVIKKQNPMGDPKIWFVDNGAAQGFIPMFCLLPLQNVEDEVIYQPEKLPTTSHGSAAQREYDVPPDTDSPPPYDSVVSVDNATGHLYEEIKNEELYYVLHDLPSTAEHMLQVNKGQVVNVLHKEDYNRNPEWWFVEDRFKNSGYVPASYLSKYD